jgi:hypothetical protein
MKLFFFDDTKKLLIFLLYPFLRLFFAFFSYTVCLSDKRTKPEKKENTVDIIKRIRK